VREVEKDVYRITGERRGFDPETTEKPLLAAEQAAMGTSDEPRLSPRLYVHVSGAIAQKV
jgi:hypothetical protein